jgi:hypothetical protein
LVKVYQERTMGMKEAAQGVLKEWDILPKDRHFDLANVTDWLIRFLGPEMEKLRREVEKEDS